MAHKPALGHSGLFEMLHERVREAVDFETRVLDVLYADSCNSFCIKSKHTRLEGIIFQPYSRVHISFLNE